MSTENTKQPWVAPKLEQIAMLDTSTKAVLINEGIQPDGTMLMAATGKGS